MERGTEKQIDLTPLDAVFELLETHPMRSLKKLILDDLAFLKAILMDPPQQFVEDGRLKQLEHMVVQIGSILSTFDLKKLDQEMASQLQMHLFTLLTPFKDRKYEAQMIYGETPKPTLLYYPTIGQLIFIKLLVKKLEELVMFKADVIGPLKHLISNIQRVLNSSLMEIDKPRKEQGDLKDFVDTITNFAYQVEFAIDSFLLGEIPIWHCMLWLPSILDEFKLDEKETDDPMFSNIVVGFKAEIDSMLDRLTGEPKNLCIVSIFGMAGQGKTTLARKLYSHPSIVNHFHVRAWCRVSQVYEKRELLLELLKQIVEDSSTIHQKNDEELAAMLKRSLLGRRFLIFLDDLWNTNAWNDLQRCFPEGANGSRILFTTRIRDLAFQARSGSILQSISPLEEDESWELLEKKLFHKGSCPPELQEVGRQIAKHCKGLPLSVILAAGILAKVEMKQDQWQQIAETIGSLKHDAEAQGIVELSYNHLPNHLKSCFLYFGAFLEDREVPVWKLTQFWIAEGFIKHADKSRLEDVAEEYLNNLITRSLITVGQEKSIGGVKSCYIHDILHDFCLIKATGENFSQLIRGYDHFFLPSGDNLDYGLDSTYSYTKPTVYHKRRVCIYSKRNHFIMLKPSGTLVRSLLFIAASDMCPTYSYDISFISQNFKLLRILDLEDINIGNSFEAIVVLVLLRYLAVQGYFDSIPSYIANLKNLETFCVKGLGTEVTVPDSIWDMVKLRHVHINGTASFDIESCRLENSTILDNLQTLSTPTLAYGDGMEKMLKRVTGIKKLKCIFLDSRVDDPNCNQFPDLKFLHQLISLKVSYNGRNPCEFRFPSNLKKLTLSNFRMSWSEISQLASLRSLEVLKLLSNAFVGEEWEMEYEEFTNLKFLKLDTLNIERWIAFSENFPRLKHLVLNKCEQLQEIPLEIGDISTLEMIEVLWCSHSVAKSAKSILDDYGEGLKVHIHPNVSDSQSSSESE